MSDTINIWFLFTGDTNVNAQNIEEHIEPKETVNGKFYFSVFTFVTIISQVSLN